MKRFLQIALVLSLVLAPLFASADSLPATDHATLPAGDDSASSEPAELIPGTRGADVNRRVETRVQPGTLLEALPAADRSVCSESTSPVLVRNSPQRSLGIYLLHCSLLC